ncbi:MAG: hypothetical protein ACFFEA_11395 [Candidatus Thorarchaeota archaeon]
MDYWTELRKSTLTSRRWSIDLAFWLKMTVLVIILLFLPLEFHYYEAVQPFPASNYYDILYSSAILDHFDYPISIDQFNPTPIYSSPLTIAAAIAISIPGIILNRRIRNRDRTESIWDIGLASLFGTAIITVYLVEYFPPNDLAWLIQTPPAWKLLRFSTLVIMVLILLPIMLREISHQGLQLKHKILVYSIAPLSLFSPAGIMAGFPRDYANYQIGSAFYQITYQPSIPIVPWQPPGQVYIAVTMLTVMDLLYTLIFMGLPLLYGLFTLRFLHGHVSRRRVCLLGVLSILIPYFIAYQMFIVNNPVSTTLIPIPILLIVGILIITVVNPISPDSILADPKREPFKGIKDTEASISIPLLYVVKSRLLRVRRRIDRNSNAS